MEEGRTTTASPGKNKGPMLQDWTAEGAEARANAERREIFMVIIDIVGSERYGFELINFQIVRGFVCCNDQFVFANLFIRIRNVSVSSLEENLRKSDRVRHRFSCTMGLLNRVDG
jgi:hypothetical protein